MIRKPLTVVALVAALLPVELRPASRLPERARSGMVASVSGHASSVGVEVMRRGGNAVDAAVAVGFVLAVTWPSAGNIGGGGFMMVAAPDGSSEVIDYRERAPLAATADMYLDEDGKVIDELSTLGHRAVAVPGTVAGLWLAHQRHGRLPWKDVVEPARRLAADGFVVDQYLANSLCVKLNRERLSRFAESRRIFLRDGRCFEYGEVFRQPELAQVLGRIRDRGPEGFYEGETAAMIVAEMRANGGLLSTEDLSTYQPTLRRPLRTTYRGWEVLAMPPPSSGGVALIQMLEMLEPVDVSAGVWGSANHIHRLVETMKRAFSDRAKYMGDTDFVDDVPIEGMLDPDYIAKIASSISMTRTTPSAEISNGNPFVHESRDTTHFSIVDRDGMMVSNTYTLNSSYGSAVTVPGTGILLNNEMDDFTSAPGVPNTYGLIQSEANAVAPRKRPLSAMTPTILLKDGKPRLATGSPGGPTIINTVLQTIVNVVDFGMNIQEAVDAPRIHHQWLPDEIEWEPRGVNPDTRAILESRGHVFHEKPEFMGDAETVMIDESGDRLGSSDPRRGGVSRGY